MIGGAVTDVPQHRGLPAGVNQRGWLNNRAADAASFQAESTPTDIASGALRPDWTSWGYSPGDWRAAGPVTTLNLYWACICSLISPTLYWMSWRDRLAGAYMGANEGLRARVWALGVPLNTTLQAPEELA